MKDEIFRFFIVRNPEKISREKQELTTIRLIDEPTDQYAFYTRLVALKKEGAGRERLITTATSFLKNIPALNPSLIELTDWLYNEESPTGARIREKATILFGIEDFSTLIKELKKEKITLSDSLVVASIAKPDREGYRSDLIQLRCIIFLLEQLAQNPSSLLPTRMIRRMLAATILLPADLFPIPDNNEKRREEYLKAYKAWKENIEKEQQEINQAIEKLKQNEAAIEELTDVYSKYLFELKHTKSKLRDTDASGSSPANEAANNKNSFLSILPNNKYKTLSSQTKKIIRDELKIQKGYEEVPFIISKLESNNAKIANKLGQIDLPADWSILSSLPTKGDKIGPCVSHKPVEPKLANNFNPDTRGRVDIIGLQDLLIVRQELLKYEPGEIAHIENILQGEFKNKKHRKLDRSEVTVFEETEDIKETEEELQTTDRYELQNEASRTLSQDISVEGGVTWSYSYGKHEFGAYANGAYNRASEESSRSATTIAKDVVSRSLQKIKDRVLKRRSRTDISEVEVINEHGFDNKGGDKHVTGIYRWVDKYYKAEVVNYGKRMMIEFLIPEPAAFYRFALSNKPKIETGPQKPDEPGFCRMGVFKKLKPTDLNAINYLEFIAKYEVRDVTPPPQNYIEVSKNIRATHDESANNTSIIQFTEQVIKAPEKYRIIGVSYRIHIGMSHVANTDGKDEMHLSILLGEKYLFEKNMREYKPEGITGDTYKEDYVFFEPQNSELPKTLVYSKGENIDELSLSVIGFSSLALSVNIGLKILCERTEQAYQQWQIDTYNAIMTAYQTKRIEYEEALRAQEFNNSVNIQGRNPLLNREIEKIELKKQAISIFTGQQYESFNAMGEDIALGYPQMDLVDAGEEGSFVGFFEQALEWRHITYLFYPYFWSNKKNWVELLNLKDTDPLFEKFLQAGYARVWVPVRPGFESAIEFYKENGGTPWTERRVPTVEDKDGYLYVSLSDEIKEQLNGDFTKRTGTLNLIQGDKKVTGTDTDFDVSDVDRELLINLETYRIAQVLSETEITLTEAYRGETSEGLGYAVGVKFVGEPWVVKVPTSLVVLHEGLKL